MSISSLRSGGLLGRLGESRRRKLEEFLCERLEQSETLQATLPMTQTRNPAELGVLLADISLWAPEALAAVPGRMFYYGIGISDRTVYLVSWRSLPPERPHQVIAAIPRSDVSVDKWKRPGRLSSGTLVLKLQDKYLKVYVPSMHRDEADNLVAVLGDTPI